MKGITSDKCRVSTKKIVLPGLDYDAGQKTFTSQGDKVDRDAVVTDMHYAEIDDGVSIDSVKHARVRLETR